LAVASAEPFRVAFVGTGWMARCHAYALDALPVYYDDAPAVRRLMAVSPTPERASAFAERHGFARAAAIDDVWASGDVDTVFISTPNRHHFEQAQKALAMPNVRRVYVEKPLCVTPAEESAMREWRADARVRLWVGFQLLQMATVRHALAEWREGALGAPLSFRLSLLHSSYLDPQYRATRARRLAPAPEGGALVDLASHLFSLAVTFLGPALEVVGAHTAPGFDDVDPRSDLHTLTVLRDGASGAVGTVTCSRIAAGEGESLEVALWGTRGALRLSTARPDQLEICRQPTSNEWTSIQAGGDYGAASRFPTRHVSAGWLRPLVHAHYLFFSEAEEPSPPDLAHGLDVQRLLRETLGRLR
jgi:predicted dehydrogenase